MADVVFNIAKKMLLDATLDLDADTLKLVLVMTNTTADTEIDVDNVDALATLDEYDGSGFTWGHGNTGRKTLGSIVVSVDDTDEEGVFDSTVDVTWSTLGAGTRANQGLLLMREGTTNDTDAIPIAFFDASFTGNGGDVTIQWNAEGILNLN